MLDGIKTTVRFANKARAYRTEGGSVLEDYIFSEYPHYAAEFSTWFRNSRNANIIAFTSIIGEALCDLEGITYDERRKKTAFFSGAVARTSDDLLDNGEASVLEASVFEHPAKIRNDRIGLLYSFESGLLQLLPVNFLGEFSHVITQFNKAQADSISQKQDISDQLIIDIRNRTGGYGGLLLYSCIFPENGDLSAEISPIYAPNGGLPQTKGQALYNLGAWFNRVDDFCDWLEDSRSGTKQLVTKKIISWKSLKTEADYVFTGLAMFYSLQDVARLRTSFQIFTNPLFIISRTATYFRDQWHIYRV